MNDSISTDSNTGEKTRKVMLVDDDTDVRAVITMGLEQLGFHVIQCVDGREAIEKFALERPDVAIIDQRLPDTPGIEVGRQIKQMSGEYPVAIALLTGADGPALRLEAQQAQFDGFLVKPTRIQMLAKWINSQIDKST